MGNDDQVVKACQTEGAAWCGEVQHQVSSGPEVVVHSGRVKAKAVEWQSPPWKGLVPCEWAATNRDLHSTCPDHTPHLCMLPAAMLLTFPTYRATHPQVSSYFKLGTLGCDLYSIAIPYFWILGRRLGRNQSRLVHIKKPQCICFPDKQKNSTHLPAFV